jgi:hypothetical protein
MANILRHPENIDEDDEEAAQQGMPALPDRGINGTR